MSATTLQTGLMTEAEYPAFRRIQDVSFARILKQFLGKVPPGKKAGDRNGSRYWQPDARTVAVRDEDGTLAGGIYLQVLGSRGISGPLAIAPEYQRPWRKDTARVVCDALFQLSAEVGCEVVDGVTFPQSATHYELYWKYGIPVFQSPFLIKPVTAPPSDLEGARWSDLSPTEQATAADQIRAITERFWPGFRLDADLTHVAGRRLGEVIVVREGGIVAGFAICHHGAESESFALEQLLIKQLYVHPDAGDPERVFHDLLARVESHAAGEGLQVLGGMVSSGRRAAAEAMRVAGWQILGIESQWIFSETVPRRALNDLAAQSFRPEHFALAEWR